CARPPPTAARQHPSMLSTKARRFLSIPRSAGCVHRQASAHSRCCSYGTDDSLVLPPATGYAAIRLCVPCPVAPLLLIMFLFSRPPENNGNRPSFHPVFVPT